MNSGLTRFSVSIPFKRESLSKVTRVPKRADRVAEGFHSLQTGKPIQSFLHFFVWKCSELGRHVSIPFKRESLSKARGKPMQFSICSVSIPFKRESLSKDICLLCNGYFLYVSIPFKRESLSKGKEREVGRVSGIIVSIPFKRESLSKAAVQDSWIDG